MAWIQGGDELSEEWLSGENIHGPTPIELMQDDALKLPTRVSSGYNATRFSRPEDRPVSSRLLFRSLLLPLVIGLWIGLVVTQADGQAEEPVPAVTQHDVQAILLRHCTVCHGRHHQEGGLSLLDRKSLLKGG